MTLLDLDVVYRGFFNDYSDSKIGGTKIFENFAKLPRGFCNFFSAVSIVSCSSMISFSMSCILTISSICTKNGILNGIFRLKYPQIGSYLLDFGKFFRPGISRWIV